MAKAKREMEANIGLIDCAVELLDARAPLASRNPDLKQMLGNKPKITVLNKSDLADPDLTKAWLSYFTDEGERAVAFCASRSGGRPSFRHWSGPESCPAGCRPGQRSLYDTWPVSFVLR